MTTPFRQGPSMRNSLATSALLLAAVAPLGAAPLAAQSLEGSKWTIEQEGVDSQVVWWLGSQGRVRTGDVGTILAGYKWRQAGDSVIVSVGDTVRYAGTVITNRLVGVRTGPRQQEGWWSGARADGPDAVAASTLSGDPAVGAAATAAVPANTQQMSRPVENTPASTPAVTPAGAATTAAAPRTLQRIERSDAPASSTSAAAPAGGREIRRIERPNAMAPTAPVPSEALVGRWLPADTGGVITTLDLKADGTGMVALNNGNKGRLEWSNETEGTRLTLTGSESSAVLRAWQEGGYLNVVVLTASGPRRTWRFRRSG